MKDYLNVLRRADEWYRRVQRAHPDKVTCAKGCRDCCLGLFDVSIADRDLLRQGLAAADEATRKDIRARASDILARLRAAFPGLGDTLEGLSDERVDEICDLLGPVECPVLGPQGECRLYDRRPLTCRLAGVPVVDVSGREIAAEGCAKCTLRAQDAPRIDWQDLRRRETKVLRRLDPDKPDVTLLIPQALE